MPSYILRGAFILFTSAVAVLYVLPLQESSKLRLSQVALAVGIAMAISLGMIILDVALRRKRLAVISGVFVGMIAGLIVGWAMGLIVDLFGIVIGIELMEPADKSNYRQAMSGI